ncbi:interferon regulatory factor 3 [Austrofundulus limnaeus]|uniref:Interferon regulatory factor 3 n=1 Tax=Austrofundulus limnaeus TaxID=52670 RepID=A0A2I4B7P1_AUSLI|nr:PREDICTED: interferon regulatory factor 3-like [Austrofundulus limnaeus]
MAHQKPLLIPWLRDQIDSGRYPGVQWTNPEQTEFSVPWKHALRQDSSSTDVLIFKAWAQVSGSQPHGDPSIWKRNFRSALRVKGFELVSDSKNDAANPHKVFRWPKGSVSGAVSAAGFQKLDDASFVENFDAQNFHVPFLEEDIFIPQGIVILEYPAGHDNLQECLNNLNIGPGAEGTAGFEFPSEQQQLQDQFVIGGHPLPGQQRDPVTFEGAAGETGLPEQPVCPMEGAEGGGYQDGQYAAQFLQTVNETREGDSFKTHFRITVYYRGVKVSEQLVENEAGFRLVYRPELNHPVMDPGTGLSLVSLPQPKDILDQTQSRLTERILEMLGNGLELRVSGYVVYGQRCGETKAFWSLSKFDGSRRPREISKLQPEPLFLLRDFIKGIIDFSNGGECPPCSLFFCLGEKWPDPENRPLEKKLLSVEVTLTAAESLKNIAVEGGASSLQSVELQVSLEEMMEQC